MKKALLTILSMLLIFSLVGCDGAISFMGKMGKNVAGVDKKLVASAVEAAKAEPVKKSDDGEFDLGTEAKLSIKTEEGSGKISLGEVSIELKNEAALEALGKVESIIAPKDLSAVVEAAKSSTNGDSFKAEMNKAVEDEETKKAAEGTQALLRSLTEEFMNNDENSGEDSPIADIEEDLRDLIAEVTTPKEELTHGDVVVLTALTNVFVDGVDVFSSLINGKDDNSGSGTENPGDDTENPDSGEVPPISEEEQDVAIDKILGSVLSLNEVITNIPSTMSDKMSGLLGGLLSNIGSGSDNNNNPEPNPAL